MQIKIHRKRSVATEVFHVALAVTEEGTRFVSLSYPLKLFNTIDLMCIISVN
ncbi:MAG: hypothetical protein HDS88_00995 [Bacteroidales bacterium]|nr:hypothetical protein [Bacteroidales bacterium]